MCTYFRQSHSQIRDSLPSPIFRVKKTSGEMIPQLSRVERIQTSSSQSQGLIDSSLEGFSLHCQQYLIELPCWISYHIKYHTTPLEREGKRERKKNQQGKERPLPFGHDPMLISECLIKEVYSTTFTAPQLFCCFRMELK